MSLLIRHEEDWSLDAYLIDQAREEIELIERISCVFQN
jgi:hypothetical protein